MMGCECLLWNMLGLDSFSALADVSAMLIDCQYTSPRRCALCPVSAQLSSGGLRAFSRVERPILHIYLAAEQAQNKRASL